VNTQVLIQDGSTILVGGIYIDKQSVSTAMIRRLNSVAKKIATNILEKDILGSKDLKLCSDIKN
jgi:hypothetical protein